MCQGVSSEVGSGRGETGRANRGQLRKGLGCFAKELNLRFLIGNGMICIVFEEDYSGRA